MKLLVKILGGILYGFLLILMGSMLLGGIGGSIYGIVWTWTSFEPLTHILHRKIGITGLFVIWLFGMLTFTYLILDEHVNLSSSFPVSPSKYRPTPSKQEKKSKPILG